MLNKKNQKHKQSEMNWGNSEFYKAKMDCGCHECNMDLVKDGECVGPLNVVYMCCKCYSNYLKYLDEKNINYNMFLKS